MGDSFGFGGVGFRAYEIYSHLKDRHDITLLCRKYPGSRDGVIMGLRHIFVGKETNNFTLALLSYAKKASEFVRENGEQYDCIIEEFSPAIPTFLNFYKKRPLILQIQAYIGKHYFNKYNIIYSPWLYLSEKVRPGLYKNIIFVSDVTKDRFNVTEKDKTFVKIIPNGINEKSIEQEVIESDYILFLGRIDIYQKGLDILIKACKDVYDHFPDLRIVIAGAGRDMEKFQRLMKELPDDIRKKISLPGWVEGEKKRSLLRNALLKVMPSRHESQPLTLLEAAASAKPLIVSDIKELRIVTEKGAGISFPSKKPSLLADSICRMLKDKELRIECGQKGRLWSGQFTWKNIASDFESYLIEVSGSM
jgi:glycosyltransferase involved in cell wall biosynthesis